MRPGKLLKPGRLRYLASLAALTLLAAWLASGWIFELAATTLHGRATLKNGCVELEYSIQPPLPSNVQIGAFIPWPTRGECGMQTRHPEESGLRWWYRRGMTISTTGTVTTSSVPPSITTASAASIRRILTLPLWPLVLLSALIAARSWRRHLRFRAPGECRMCGYDRRGLPPHSPCPECGLVPAPR
jgi:hypothetical protein